MFSSYLRSCGIRNAKAPFGRGLLRWIVKNSRESYGFFEYAGEPQFLKPRLTVCIPAALGREKFYCEKTRYGARVDTAVVLTELHESRNSWQGLNPRPSDKHRML